MDTTKPHKILLFKEQLEISCTESCSILDATLSAGMKHIHACGGNGICSTCRVSIIDGIENCQPRNKAEQKIADKLNFPNQIRLACQTKITGNISIRKMVSDQRDMEIISEQFSDDSGLALGSQQKLTMLFSDIVNYTPFAEKFPPYDIVHVLNRYYKIMNEAIQDNHGFISDVAGDGILAIFGAQKKNNNSVLDSIHAIIEMTKRLKIFNEYLQESFNMQFKIRIGVHYGDVIIGNFDTGFMKKIAVIGDNVNHANRIEMANKDFGTSTLLSEQAYQKVKKEYPEHNLFETVLKGKTGKYKIYEIALDN